MTTTPLTDQQLADAVLLLKNRLAAAFEHMDAHQWGYDHGFCGEYGVDPETDSFVDTALAIVRPELDRLAAELVRVRAELATTQAELWNLLAAAEGVHTVLHDLIVAEANPGARARAAWTALDTALIAARPGA